MDIYVVQPGDDIYSIAKMYGVSAEKLFQDNELDTRQSLVPGQTIVITYPKQTYMVQEGDTLIGIADAYGVTIMQLLRNNPSLSGGATIYPGETIIISYPTSGQITMNGYAYPYIKKETLLKTLPGLTYLTVFNYRADGEGEIITYYDDTQVIQMAKEYGVAPLMMIATLTPQGQQDLETAYDILLNEEYQEHAISNMLNIMKTRGYYGVNMAINNINISNQSFYTNYIIKASNRIRMEGFLFFLTINPNIENVDNKAIFENVDFSKISPLVDGLIFLQFIWGNNSGPPGPIININNIRIFIGYAASQVPPDLVTLGTPLVSYDWELPYIPGRTVARSLTIEAALRLANDVGAIIQFDESSQTPYFYYNRLQIGPPAVRIVWSIDARSVNAIDQLVREYGLNGLGLWNIMVYYPQLWLIINSQYEIVKVLPPDPNLLAT